MFEWDELNDHINNFPVLFTEFYVLINDFFNYYNFCIIITEMKWRSFKVIIENNAKMMLEDSSKMLKNEPKLASIEYSILDNGITTYQRNTGFRIFTVNYW